MNLNKYKNHSIPSNLSFDEESLYWRLRLGEGLPTHEWHKPLERHLTWDEVKINLDQKIDHSLSTKIFYRIYPKKYQLKIWLKKLIRSVKIAFLLSDT